MPVLVARGIEKAWGGRMVLQGCDLVVERGEVVGLVGPNGCGKSTLLHILGGAVESDGGQVDIQGRLDLLAQDPPLEGMTVREAAAEALGWHRELIADYQQALEDGALERAGAIQDRLDHVGWELDHQVDAMLSRVDAPPSDRRAEVLSGGERRRVALARALLSSPDVLLLDEPTNHLDHATIDWLQGWISAFDGGIVLVTHDRYMLEAVATRIVEIEDGQCVSYDGSYADFLVARAERQASLRRTEDSRLALIAREAVWASRSPAARSTKQKARLERLEALQDQGGAKLDQGAMSLDLSTGLKQGQTVMEATGLCKAFGDRQLFHKLDLSLLRGERLAILGPNGAGKSTLLHLVAGTLAADAGQIRLSPRVKVAVLDQHRSGLHDGDTVFEAAGGGATHVEVGDRVVHVKGLLGRFLFDGAQHDAAVSTLSGGERARLLLARMMLEGANLLLLDEPTNDLDLMTLRVLEEALLSFDGSAIIVTHDRAFLDRVATSVLAFEPDGVTTRYADRSQANAAARRRQDAASDARRVTKPVAEAPKASRSLSYKDKQELAALPDRIAKLEAEVAALEARLAEPEVWLDDTGLKLSETLRGVEADHEQAWERWSELDDKQSGA